MSAENLGQIWEFDESVSPAHSRIPEISKFHMLMEFDRMHLVVSLQFVLIKLYFMNKFGESEIKNLNDVINQISWFYNQTPSIHFHQL